MSSMPVHSPPTTPASGIVGKKARLDLGQARDEEEREAFSDAHSDRDSGNETMTPGAKSKDIDTMNSDLGREGELDTNKNKSDFMRPEGKETRAMMETPTSANSSLTLENMPSNSVQDFEFESNGDSTDGAWGNKEPQNASNSDDARSRSNSWDSERERLAWHKSEGSDSETEGPDSPKASSHQQPPSRCFEFNLLTHKVRLRKSDGTLTRMDCQQLFRRGNDDENQPELVAYLNEFLAERDIGGKRYYYFRKDMKKPWQHKSKLQIKMDLKHYQVRRDKPTRPLSLFDIWTLGAERRIFEIIPELERDEFTEFIEKELEFGAEPVMKYRAKTVDIEARFNANARAGKPKMSIKKLMPELVARWGSEVTKVENGRAGGSKDRETATYYQGVKLKETEATE